MTLSWWPPAPSTRRVAPGSWCPATQPELAQRTAPEAEGLTGDQRLSLLEFVREADYFHGPAQGHAGVLSPAHH